MKRAFIFFLLLSAIQYSFAQTNKTIELTDKLLTNGSHKAAITVYEFPDEIQVLQQKAMKNLKANPEWADKYIVRMVEKGTKDISYMDAYGLTREEFNKMLTGFKNGKRAVFTDTFNISIKRANDIITFKAEGKLTAFNYFNIDLKKKHIIYDNLLLTKENELTGQNKHAPILYGYEALRESKIPGQKKVTKVNALSFNIGKNRGDTRTTISLVLIKGLSDVDFLTITLL
jgi:hypothetical protein